jgi:hypothetical protein
MEFCIDRKNTEPFLTNKNISTPQEELNLSQFITNGFVEPKYEFNVGDQPVRERWLNYDDQNFHIFIKKFIEKSVKEWSRVSEQRGGPRIRYIDVLPGYMKETLREFILDVTVTVEIMQKRVSVMLTLYGEKIIDPDFFKFENNMDYKMQIVSVGPPHHTNYNVKGNMDPWVVNNSSHVNKIMEHKDNEHKNEMNNRPR